MTSQPRRCPTCMNIMPLARRKCPNCFREHPLSDDTRSLEVLFLQEKLAGKFEIISELHRRGNSTMFLAQDLILDRKVALKTLKFEKNAPPVLVERWNQNLKRCLRLDEPHLARIYTYGSTGSLHYIILEFIAIDTLEDILAGEKSGLPIWKCLRIGRDIAQGLHAAHNLGIIHHRLTPANIAVSRDGFSRVLDLGAAQGTIDALAQRPWSAVMDNSLYFAPEQIESGISEHQADQYRIASILYHALAGHPAFENGGEEGAFARINQDPKPLSELRPSIPEELSAIVAKAMSRHPDDRFVDCNEFALQLESLEPDLWLPDIEPGYRASTPEATVALLLSEAQRNELNREYYRALVLCDQALTLAPYNTDVTSTMLRIQKLHDKEQNLRSLVNKALVAFYSDSLNESLKILQTGRQIDKENPEILRLTHEVMQEQERKRLINVLIDAAKIDLSKQAYSAAMSNVVRVLDIDARNEAAIKLKQRVEVGMEERTALGAMLTRAVSAFERDHLEEAEDVLERVRQMDPDNFSAKKLKDKIEHQKKHHLLMDLWENMDREFRCGQYRKAIEILKRIAQIEPSLKLDIRDRLVRIREKLAEQNDVCDTGETQPIRAVRPSDLTSRDHERVILVDPEKNLTSVDIEQSLEKTPAISINTSDGQMDFQVVSDESSKIDSENFSGNRSVSVELQSASVSDSKKVDFEEEPNYQKPISRVQISSQRYAFKKIIPWILVIVFIIIVTSILLLDRTNNSNPQLDISETALPAALNAQSPSSTTTPSQEADSYLELPTPSPTISDIVSRLLHSALNNERIGNHEMAAALYREVIGIERGNQEALAGIRRANAVAAQNLRNTPKHDPDPIPTRKRTSVSTRPPATEARRQIDVPPTPTAKAISIPQSPIIESLVSNPEKPIKGKPLQLVIRFKAHRGHNVTQMWLNYKKRSDSFGYSQVFAKRTGNRFEVTIPGDDVRGTSIQYYLNGFDETSNEFFIGSPNDPKIMP